MCSSSPFGSDCAIEDGINVFGLVEGSYELVKDIDVAALFVVSVVFVAKPEELRLFALNHRLDLSVGFDVAKSVAINVLIEHGHCNAGDVVIGSHSVFLPAIGGPVFVVLAEHLRERLLGAVGGVLEGGLAAWNEISEVHTESVILTKVVLSIVKRKTDVIDIGGVPVWSKDGVDLVVLEGLEEVGGELVVGGDAEVFVRDGAEGLSYLILPLFTTVPVVRLSHSPVVEGVVELVVLLVGELALPVSHGGVVRALRAGWVMAAVAELTGILFDVRVVSREHAAVVETFWLGEASEADVLDDASGLSDDAVDVSGRGIGESAHHDEGLLTTSAESHELWLFAIKAIGVSCLDHLADESGEILLADLVLRPVPEFHGTIGGIIGVTSVTTKDSLVKGARSGGTTSVSKPNIVSKLEKLGGVGCICKILIEPGAGATILTVDEDNGSERALIRGSSSVESCKDAEKVQVVAFSIGCKNGTVSNFLGLNKDFSDHFVEQASFLRTVVIEFEGGTVGEDTSSSLGDGGDGGGGCENLERFHSLK